MCYCCLLSSNFGFQQLYDFAIAILSLANILIGFYIKTIAKMQVAAQLQQMFPEAGPSARGFDAVKKRPNFGEGFTSGALLSDLVRTRNLDIANRKTPQTSKRLDSGQCKSSKASGILQHDDTWRAQPARSNPISPNRSDLTPTAELPNPGASGIQGLSTARVPVRDVKPKNIDETPWEEFELPPELEMLGPGVPDEIQNIIQESVDEHRALRLSMQGQAIVVRTTITTEQTLSSGNEPIVAESSAMASNRYANSSLSSVRSNSINLSLESTTSLESSQEGSNVPQSSARVGEGKQETLRGSHHSETIPPSRKLQKGKEKIPGARGLFRFLRTPKASSTTEREPEPEFYECTSCFDDISSCETITVPCRHKYCAACFSQLIATAIQNENHFPPKCCLQEIPRGILRQKLTMPELNAFDQKALEYSVAIGSRYYCARPECAKWIDTTHTRTQNGALTCPHCNHNMCPLCRGSEHGSHQDCPQDFGLDATLRQAERAGWQRCYNCRAMVELNTGCRHITCKCKAEFW